MIRSSLQYLSQVLVLQTGLAWCYDQHGRLLDCAATEAQGQDAACAKGIPWPEPRFFLQDDMLVQDRLTGLVWSRDANPFGFPCTWREALEFVRQWNSQGHLGRQDWRLPNRRELRSLVSHGNKRPALPAGHPFLHVFQGWYWSSTTAARATAYAWYVHFAGGRMFYGAKSQDCLLWPVCNTSSVLARTGQLRCYGEQGRELDCQSPSGQGQDGALQHGLSWPEPRFVLQRTMQPDDAVLDRLTNIVWQRDISSTGLATWSEALLSAERLAAQSGLPWRLPNINELESLVDASCHSPALPQGHLFRLAGQAFWSSTSSFFEPDWSYCLYLDKGAVGVGYKQVREFFVWLVLDAGDVPGHPGGPF